MIGRKVLIGFGIFGLIAAIIGAVMFGMRARDNKNVVKVYPVEMLNSGGGEMYEYGSELTGVLTSDYVQQVIPDGSREIQKIYVEVGDKVKKGDKLLKYNVEEQELDLELQRLQIESSKMQIEKMEEELEKLKKTKPVKGEKGESGDGSPKLVEARAHSSNMKAAAGTLLAAAGDTPAAPASENNKETPAPENTQETYDTGVANGTNPNGGSGDNTPANDGSNIILEDSNNNPKTDANTETVTPEENQEAIRIQSLEDAKARAAQISTQEDVTQARQTAKDILDSIYLLYEKEKYKYDRDKDKAKNITDNYKSQIDNETDTKKISSLATTGINELSGLADASVKRGPAVDEINAYLAQQRYGSDAEAKSLQIYDTYCNDKEESLGKIYTALTGEAVDNEKKACLEELKALEGGPLYTYIDNAETQRSANSGDGSTQEKTIRFLLVKKSDGSDPTILGSVVNQFFTDYAGKYIEFRVYNSASDYPEGSPGLIFQLTPEAELNGVINFDHNYTVEEIQKLTEQPPVPVVEYLLKSVTSYTQHQYGNGTLKSKYQYFLRLNAPINGSVIKDLIKKKKYATFRDYLSEDAFAAGAPARNTITIMPGTQFTRAISSKKKYTIEQLNKLIIVVDSIKVYPSTQNLTTVYRGSSYQFNATIKGKNLSGIKVKWSIKNAKNNHTRISTSGLLVVDKDEKSSAIKVTARAAGKSGSYIVKVKKGDGTNGNNGTGTDGEQQTYTKEELKEAIEEKEEEIAEAKQELSEAKINYREQKKEVDAAIVRAKIKGKVTVADMDAPIDQPAVVIRGDDGMYVRTAVSELDLDTVKVGGTITVTSNETGDTYEAVVKEVSEYPVDGAGTEFGGNPNSSYYPLTAYIEEAEELKIGERVTITYNSESMGTGTGTSIYISKAYVRTEGKQSYVYKAGKDGRLEKANVKTGKVIEGQIVEIVSGLSMDDAVAFPYGKNLKEGLPTELSDNQEDIIF